MAEDLEVRIIDQLTKVVERAPSMPRHKTVKYRRPVVVLPTDCPLLCVWLLAKEAAPRTTDNDDSLISIGVSWQVEAVERAEKLVDDPKKSVELLKTVLEIQGQVRHLFQSGWAEVAEQDIPEAYDGWLAGVDYTPPTSLETGLVEGYAATVRVMALERRHR